MALRRAPRDEFLIKTFSESQNTPPPHPHPKLPPSGGVGSTGTAGPEEPGPALRALCRGRPRRRGRAARGSHRGRGSQPAAAEGYSEARGTYDMGCPTPRLDILLLRCRGGPAGPPASPGWTGRAAGRAPRSPPNPAGRNIR